MKAVSVALCALALSISACAPVHDTAGATAEVVSARKGQAASLVGRTTARAMAERTAGHAASVAQVIVGQASWYGGKFHGRKTASGERFDMNGLTAAHRTLPFGTKVRVVNEETGQSVVVRVNDRGPWGHGRIIDLSRAAAERIGLRHAGVGRVKVEVLKGA